jgi:predicted metalloendopeptidase
MNHRLPVCFARLAAFLLVALTVPAGAAAAPAAAVGDAPAGFSAAFMDPDMRPQDNFYEFVNGGWLAATEIPADRPRWGAFDELIEQSDLNVLEIIREAVEQRDAGHKLDTELAMIADLYRSYMDEATVEAADLAPLGTWLERVAGLSSHEELAEAFGALRTAGALETTPIDFWIDLDLADTGRYTVYFTQSGLGMPDRDYYLLDDERMAATRAAYAAYIAGLFELAGWAPAQAQAAAGRVLALETAIAERHWTRAARRDRQLTFNPTPAARLETLAPGFAWQRYLAGAELAGQDEHVLRELSFFTAFAELFAATPVSQWREYLRFRLLDDNASLLSAGFADAHFDFHSRTISGVPEQQARWNRAVRVVENAVGEAVGKQYVARHFSPEARARMEAMVANLKTAFRHSIDQLDWMTEDTRREAQAKLASFGLKIGYPDEWRDYAGLEIRPDDLAGNVMRARQFNYAHSVGRLGAPVDPHEWFMTPQTVNAYYSPTRNEIVFPAAILQPPFFNPEADDAVNYGAIGAVIGHEISHGFDDQGRRTDGQGLLRDWWTAQDDARYRVLADQLVAQYSAFEPIEGMHIDGQVSLGENIADLAGVTVAHRAYRLSLDGGEAPVIKGFTGDQRFFMGWAQIWRIKFRDDALRRQLVTGPHSPGRYRVIGVVRNVDAFHEAFDVSESDALWLSPEERIAIW